MDDRKAASVDFVWSEHDAVLMMGWQGAWLFGEWMPPMREFLPSAYAGWYDKLVNRVLPAAGTTAMGAFIEAEFHPLTFFRRHACRDVTVGGHEVRLFGRPISVFLAAKIPQDLKDGLLECVRSNTIPTHVFLQEVYKAWRAAGGPAGYERV